MESHYYFSYDNNRIDLNTLRKITVYVLNNYLNTNHGITKLRKLKDISFSWKDKKGEHRGKISFEELFEDIKKHGELRTNFFSLPEFQSPMFDSSIDIILPQPITGKDESGNLEAIGLDLVTNIGGNFPLKPSLRMEGFATSNLQTHVLKNILYLHHILVSQSNSVLELDSPWFMNFRMLLNECVSAVDMQLHMIYLIAQYNPQYGLNFNREKMGDRHGRRLADKFAWIGITSGNHLDDAEVEIKSFTKLKNLRNHLNHFDPPCFCCNLEEVAGWLNLVSDIGLLLFKIRDRYKAQINNPILKIINLPEVQFTPKTSQFERPSKQYTDSGYQSSTWTTK